MIKSKITKCAECGAEYLLEEHFFLCASCRIPKRKVTRGKTGYNYWVKVDDQIVAQFHEISNNFALARCNERYLAELNPKRNLL